MYIRRIPCINERHDKYIGLAFTALKRTIPSGIRRDLYVRDLHQDLEQEIAIIAFEGMKKYPQMDKDNKYLNFAGRRLYRFLRQNGYRRPKGHKSYVREDIGLPEQITISV